MEHLLQLRDFVSQPWPWYVAGPILALIMFLLLFFEKEFGISANFRTICAAGGVGRKIAFLKYDWRKQSWNLAVALGAIIGGYFAAKLLNNGESLAHISDATVAELSQLGFNYKAGEVPLVPEFYRWNALLKWPSALIILLGGFLVGFGSRYAGGCTSGHAISGLSALQVPSFIAVVGFFIGGLITTHLIFLLIF